MRIPGPEVGFDVPEDRLDGGLAFRLDSRCMFGGEPPSHRMANLDLKVAKRQCLSNLPAVAVDTPISATAVLNVISALSSLIGAAP